MTTVNNSTAHYRTCNLCEAICGIEITVEDDGKMTIKGDKDDPFSRGHICPKAVALQDLHYDQDRLKHPVRRGENGWQRISWQQAFDEVAQQLKRIQAQYGRDSVASYTGNPAIHNYGTMLFNPNFIDSLGTHNRFSSTSIDQLAHHFASYFMFGHQFMLPVPDIDRTDLLVILGANPVVSNGSMMTAPDVATRLRAIQSRGGKVILIDPRFNETAELADQHIFIRPGSDVLLLLAMLNHLFTTERIDINLNTNPAMSFSDGLVEIKQIVAGFTPEQVAPITGIDAERIRGLANLFADAKSAVCYGRIGVSTQEFGATCQWLINLLNIVTGNFDRPGGAMFALPAFDPVTAPESLAPRGSYGRWHSRVRKLPEFAGELPVVALAEEILTPGNGQIKALITSAGNPVLSTPNGDKLDRALAKLEFMVSIDLFINETTRHANIILPPTAALEHENYDLALHLLAIRNTTKYSPVLINPGEDTRHDWEIFLELQTRMEARNLIGELIAPIKRRLIHRLLPPTRMLDLGLRFGPYGGKLNPFSDGLTLRKVKASIHGIDLGALTPCLPARLRTPNKRINLAPEILVKDLARVKEKFLSSAANSSTYDLVLIGRRQLRSNNSWLHNSYRMVKGKPRCTLLMHPDDAAQRGIRSGDNVDVSSRVGNIIIAVEITEEMMPGVVSIPHGWGHNRAGVKLEVAQQHAGVSINDLTDELAIDALCGTAAFNGTLVSVMAIAVVEAV